MKRFLSVLLAAGMLASAPRAGAACRWFGSQLDCNVGHGLVVVGTQTAAEPYYTAGLRPHGFDGAGALPGGRRATGWPVRVEVQNVGADPGLCRTFGNETYCY